MQFLSRVGITLALGLGALGCATVTPGDGGRANAPAGTPAESTPKVDPMAARLVDPSDPTRGPADAPVTVVVFGDFECRHCRRVSQYLKELSSEGEGVRVVWKHFPTDDEDGARAAVIASALHRLGGNSAYWTFHDAIYREGPPSEGLGTALAEARKALPEISSQAIGKAAQEYGVDKVRSDVELGSELGVVALPTFFINGRRIVGVDSKEKLAEAIRVEREATLAQGGDLDGMRNARLTANFAAPPRGGGATSGSDPAVGGVAVAEAPEGRAKPIADSLFYVPIDGAPVDGPKDAWVTIVEFGDFECGYCRKAHKTMLRIKETFGPDVRFSFRNNPLPFHRDAEPMARIALEAYQTKGNDAFWKVHHGFYDGLPTPEQTEKVTASVGLTPSGIAGGSPAVEAALFADQLLGDSLDVDGTPVFFINGRRVEGAQNYETFAAVVREEIAEAKALVERSSVRREDLYESRLKGASKGEPPPRVTPPAIAKSAPSKGPKNAPVVLQVFSDFECPYCRKQAEVLDKLFELYPGKLRLVFHQFPIPGHPNARRAGAAALLAKEKGGDDAFWKLHDHLFRSQKELGGDFLEGFSAPRGVTMAAIEGAEERLKSVIDADVTLGRELGVTVKPATLVGPYLMSCGQSLIRMRRMVDLVLSEAAEAKAGRNPPAKSSPTQSSPTQSSESRTKN